MLSYDLWYCHKSRTREGQCLVYKERIVPLIRPSVGNNGENRRQLRNDNWAGIYEKVPSLDTFTAAEIQTEISLVPDTRRWKSDGTAMLLP